MGRRKEWEFDLTTYIGRLGHAVHEFNDDNKLVSETGFLKSYIQSILKGQEPTLGRAIEITKACGYHMDWIAFGIGPEKLEEDAMSIFESSAISIPPLDQTQNLDIEFTPEYIKRNLRANPESVVSWIVSSDELPDSYEKGNTILIDKETKSGDGDFVIKVGDTYTIRNFRLSIIGPEMVYATTQGNNLIKQDNFNKENIVGRIIWNGGRA